MHRLLTNPVYAGAYAFGRTESRVRVENGRRHVTRGFRRSRDDWDVLIRDHHKGYVSGWSWPNHFRTTLAFLPSTRALSFERRARDFVKLGTCSLLSIAATWWLTYSEPLSAWKPSTAKRQREQHLLQHRHQERLGNGGHRADVLELGDLVDQVHVVHALGAVAVALIHRVHADVSRAGRIRPPPLADPRRGRPRVLEGRPPRPVGLRPPQVVQVRHRQPRQAPEAGVAEHLVLAPQHLVCRGPAELAADLVGLRHQADVRRRVHPLERPAAVGPEPILDAPRLPVLGLLPKRPLTRSTTDKDGAPSCTFAAWLGAGSRVR